MNNTDQEPIIVTSSVMAAPASIAALRGSVLQKWDIRLTLILFFSFLFHAGFLVYLYTVPIPKAVVLAPEAIPERLARFIMDKPIKKEKKKSAAAGKEKGAAKAEEATSPEKKAENAKKEKEIRVKKAKKRVAQRAKAVQKKLVKAGMLAVLSGVGGTARGPAVVDVLGKQGRIRGVGDLDKALAGISGLRAGGDAMSQKLVRSRDAVGSSQKGDISSLIAGLTQAKSGALAKRGSIQYKKPEIIGEASNSAKRAHTAINRVVKKNLPRIKFSYEKQLKKNPQLAGKITIRFIIEEDGSVSDVEVIESTMDSQELISDITRKIKRWKFEALSPGSGSIGVTYPFIFQPT